jgi:hypothetical protein
MRVWSDVSPKLKYEKANLRFVVAGKNRYEYEKDS